MENTSIEIRGIDELLAKLGKVQGNAVLRRPMQRAVYRIQTAMAKYPAQRPGSRYVRTGTLGRRWTTRVTEGARGLTGKVGNNTAYGPLVQSSLFQSSVHRGRWQTDEKVIKQNQTAIVADFESSIEEALK